MIAGGELNKKQLAELRKALASMELPPRKRQRLIWRLAKYGVIAAAKRHVRNQESPDGQKWPGRKTKRKGKMLRNLPKLLHIREMPEIQAVRIYLQGGGYRNGEAPVPLIYWQSWRSNVRVIRTPVLVRQPMPERLPGRRQRPDRPGASTRTSLPDHSRQPAKRGFCRFLSSLIGLLHTQMIGIGI